MRENAKSGQSVADVRDLSKRRKKRIFFVFLLFCFFAFLLFYFYAFLLFCFLTFLLFCCFAVLLFFRKRHVTRKSHWPHQPWKSNKVIQFSKKTRLEELSILSLKYEIWEPKWPGKTGAGTDPLRLASSSPRNQLVFATPMPVETSSNKFSQVQTRSDKTPRGCKM